MSAEDLVRSHGTYVITTGTMKGRRLMDLNEAELQLLAASRKQGESANRCRDFARAYLSLSALNRQPAVPAGTPSSIPLQDIKTTNSSGGNGVGGTNSVPESCQIVQFQGNPRGRLLLSGDVGARHLNLLPTGPRNGPLLMSSSMCGPPLSGSLLN